MTKTDKIKLAIHKVLANPMLLPYENITHCNEGTCYILKELGFHNPFIKDGRIMLANEMYDTLFQKYKKIEIKGIYGGLIEGKIYVACQKGSPHGHIAIIYPDDTIVYSAKWNCDVPLVANFGKVNGVMGLNWAFHNFPDFFEIGEVLC